MELSLKLTLVYRSYYLKPMSVVQQLKSRFFPKYTSVYFTVHLLNYESNIQCISAHWTFFSFSVNSCQNDLEFYIVSRQNLSHYSTI